MWRYLVGTAAGVLLAMGAMLWWRGGSTAGVHVAGLAGAAQAEAAGNAATPEPPAASEKTREEKRFSRYDHDRDGKVSRDEYLAARHKAFAKLDTNGDGKLTFDEWAIKAETKFADADADHSGTLTPAEFATTKVQRKTRPRVDCPPPQAEHRDEDEG